MVVRTRFAPSPTGTLHIGSARTALYCWLYAKHTQGRFILRIEDTDRERSTDESVNAIFDSIQWLGLDYDEGPFFQTKRFDRYREVVQQLLQEGKAYRCYCSKERLEELRSQQIAAKEKPRYDGHCRNLQVTPTNTPCVIRFANPQTGSVIVEDLILGHVEFANTELDDLIIARSDGVPTYNFTVVVDDWDMQVSHVIRGNDHLNNTPRQINILAALGAVIPKYAHLPMILGADAKKMSKRSGAVSVMQFRDEGYLPKAILNYLVRLGWSHGDQEVFSLEEMIRYFDLSSMSKAPAAFDVNKLQWLNQHYIKTLPAQEVAQYLEWHMSELQLDLSQGPPLTLIVAAFSERAKTLKEMAEKSVYFYQDITCYDEKAIPKLFTAEICPALEATAAQLQQLNEWHAKKIHHTIHQVANEFEFDNMGKIAQPLRLAISGTTNTPPIDVTLELLGKEKVVQRINQALAYIRDRCKN